MPPRVPWPFGPFLKGVVDGANTSLDLNGAARKLRHGFFDGLGRLRLAPGTALAITLKDDQVTPANVTAVLKLVEFGNDVLAVAHSTVTDKFYLYRLTSDLTDWYDAAGALQGTTNAEPVGVLWSTATDPAAIFIAEGLGEAFIAHGDAGSTFQTRKYSVAGGLSDLLADLRGSGNELTYFRGVVSFQQHLWGWGYGSETPGDNDRPELLRFGHAIFGTVGGSYFAAADSITVGHRVRSTRERVVGAFAADQVCYFGTEYALWPITGFGRNSWDKGRPVSTKFGLVGAQAGVVVGEELFFWSHRGPLVVRGHGPAQPLWDAIPETIAGIIDPSTIVGVHDDDRDLVLFFYQGPTSGSVRLSVGFDMRRRVVVGPDDDFLIGVGAAASLRPVAVTGPSGPPTTPSTTNVGSTVATANWVNGDTSPGVRTILEIKRTTDPNWTVVADLPSSQTTYQFTGLLGTTQYHWRAKHRKNGQDSTYLGPEAGTTFTTVGALLPPSACSLSWPGAGVQYIIVTWTNSGESGVSTEVEVDDPGGAVVFTLKFTAPPGNSSYAHFIGEQTGIAQARVRHVKEGFTPSAYCTTNSVTVS